MTEHNDTVIDRDEPPAVHPADVPRPGERVRVTWHRTGNTRESIVDERGRYRGQGAVLLYPDTVTVEVIEPTNDDDLYPTAITVFCDRCGVKNTGDYIVTDAIDRAERLALARTHVSTLGWSCDTTGDFCPDCRPADTGKETDR